MTFHIQLLVDETHPTILPVARLSEVQHAMLSPHDELVHVLGAQCRALAMAGGISFSVGGFGQDRWPVDVETDLAVALEQLPGVLSHLRGNGESFDLNFYEQGIERYLTGTRTNDEVKLECMSMSLRWSPNPSVERVGLVDAQVMFNELRQSYVTAVSRVCPALARGPAFERWRS